ncbi:unnamed protein product [Heterobilharzia americana]|nr:unnamed protein product [Heterobilharzia americana]
MGHSDSVDSKNKVRVLKFCCHSIRRELVYSEYHRAYGSYCRIKPSIQPKIAPIIVTEEQKESTDNDVNTMTCGEFENNNRPNSATKSKPVCGIGLGNIFSGQPIQLKQTALKDVVKENESLSEKTIGNTKISDDNGQNYTTSQVRARYEYIPKQPDELELHVDDIIHVLDRNLPDDGWWKGRNLRTNLIGMFPDNFVAPMNGSNKELDQNKLQYSINAPNLAAKSVSVKTITLQSANGSANARSPRNSSSTINASQSNPGLSSTLDAARIANKPSSQISSNRNPIISTSSPSNHQPTTTINTGTSGASLSSSGRSNSLGNSLNTNQLNIVPTSGLTQAASNSTVSNEKWRSNDKQDSYELSKPRNGIQNGGDGDGISVDSSSVQRLVGYTSERPRQTGRRLPTKLSNATNPAPDLTHSFNVASRNSNVTTGSSDIQVYDTAVNRNSVTCLPDGHINHEGNSGSVRSDQSLKPNESTIKQQGRSSSHTTSHSRGATIQRNDGSNGSVELNRSSENLQTSNQPVSNHRSKSQPNDVQHQFDQFQDEVRQQLRDIRRECDSLKEMHLQLRNDWIKGQKCLTERFQTLMDELDEIKKLRANDAVELSRFRTILMQLDANSLINSQNHISLCDTGGEDKFCTGTDFLETLGTKPNQRSVNFKAITSHEDEEDHHSDQNDNICSSDNKMSLSTQIAGQKSSGKPSLRPRPVPAYGVTGSIRS